MFVVIYLPKSNFMKHFFFFIVFFLISITGYSQKNENTKQYLGKHYGDHYDWLYYSNVSKYKIGDTLFYTQIRYNRNVINALTPPSMIHRIKYLKNNKVSKLLEEVNIYDFGPRGYYHYESIEKNDSIITLVKNRKGAIIEREAIKNDDKDISFSSLEVLELFLMEESITLDYDKKIKIGNRKFKLKTLGEAIVNVKDNTPYDCYMMSLISLDSINDGDSRFILKKETQTVVQKEYIVHEKSSSMYPKSIGFEQLIPSNYLAIKFKENETPTTNDYIDLAYVYVNEGSPEKNTARIINLMDKALEKDFFATSLYYLKITDYLKLKEKEKELIKKIKNTASKNIIGIHALARYCMSSKKLEIAKMLFDKNIKNDPKSLTTNVGLARYYSHTKEFKKATKYMRKAMNFLTPEDNKGAYQELLHKLEKGEDIN